jgi:hypothetical protein
MLDKLEMCACMRVEGHLDGFGPIAFSACYDKVHDLVAEVAFSYLWPELPDDPLCQTQDYPRPPTEVGEVTDTCE